MDEDYCCCEECSGTQRFADAFNQAQVDKDALIDKLQRRLDAATRALDEIKKGPTVPLAHEYRTEKAQAIFAACWSQDRAAKVIAEIEAIK